MTTSQQFRDMDATQAAERHLIERYLAGQLSDSEADAFESLVASQPELAPQIERVARMKIGLDLLRSKGELAQLLRERPRPKFRSPWFAVAAAASLVAIGFVSSRLISPPVTLIAATLQELADSRDSSLRIAATYVLVTERAASPATLIETPVADGGAIELRFDAAAEAGAEFSVEILQAAGNSLRSITRADSIPSSADGSVVVYVAPGVLVPGAYLFRLTPADGVASQEFAAQVGG